MSISVDHEREHPLSIFLTWGQQFLPRYLLYVHACSCVLSLHVLTQQKHINNEDLNIELALKQNFLS